MQSPQNIPMDKGFTPMPQCMPDDCKVENMPILAYQNFYMNTSDHFVIGLNDQNQYGLHRKE